MVGLQLQRADVGDPMENYGALAEDEGELRRTTKSGWKNPLLDFVSRMEKGDGMASGMQKKKKS